MLTDKQLAIATELLTNAVNYNLAMQAAFVSTEDMITAELVVDGVTQKVSIPTYHNLLATVNKLSKQVQQMQISDSGNDVIQLLSQADSLRLLYLKRKQYYVQPPKGAKIAKFDYETVPTNYSSANHTAIYIDLNDCDLPMDAVYVRAQFDNETSMLLPIIYGTTCFDKAANVLQVVDGGYLVDASDMKVGDEVQCNSSLFTVKSIVGNFVTLEPNEVSHAAINEGDVLYTITGKKTARVEVPITTKHDVLHLQIQYAGLLSAVYDIAIKEAIETGIQIGAQTSVEAMLQGKSIADVQDVSNTAIVKVPANIVDIVAQSKIDTAAITTTIKQTNTHQYINSTVEKLQRANATLELAKTDKDRYEQLLIDASLSNEQRTQYQEALVSAKQRYDAAQLELAKVATSSQDVSPVYELKIQGPSVDSELKPIVQLVVRYQCLSYDTKTLSNDWLYAYGDRRTIDKDGYIAADADSYAIQNFVRVPIRAYEQIAFQVAAVLSYGQPLLTIQTAWSDVLYTQISDNIIAEQSVADMLQNAYEARLYTNVQQALAAAGVTKHINRTDAFAHAASDITYDGNVSVADKLATIAAVVQELTTGMSEDNFRVELLYNGTVLTIANGDNITLQANTSYRKDLFDGIDTQIYTQELASHVGEWSEDLITLRITNLSSGKAYLQSLAPGATSKDIAGNDYEDTAFVIGSKAYAQRYGQLAMACSSASGDNTAYDIESIGANILEPVGTVLGGSVSKDVKTYMSNGTVDANGHRVTKAFRGIALYSANADVLTWFAKLFDNGKPAENAPIGFTFDGQSSGLLSKHKIANRKIGATSTTNLSVLTRTHFAGNDKYLAGIDTIGAFMFFYGDNFDRLVAPSVGSSNRVELASLATYDMNIKFQARMTDALGLAAINDNIVDNQGFVYPNEHGETITYSKTMPIAFRVGHTVFRFNLTFSKNYAS